MRSLRTRILFTASLVLVTFLSCASVLLDRAFRESALDAVEDRLRGRVFMLIGAANFDAAGGQPMINSLPDPSLSIPGSGNYARIVSRDGDVRWGSRSLLGVEPEYPSPVETGQWHLERVGAATGESLFSLAYSIIWEGAGDHRPIQFVIQACENQRLYLDTVGRFRRSLWLWFAALSVTLLVVQALNLSWGLRPLRRVDDEVRAIEQGHSDRIAGEYPSELTSLTRNLNKLIAHNREHLQRYRNALGDLAHSIKTPLAILRNHFEMDSNATLAEPVIEQLERLDRTVDYQLHRAATAGRSLLSPPLAVTPVVERIVDSLHKVHAHRGLLIAAKVEPGAVFLGDEGDLMEIIGNLADNGCKWAKNRVEIHVASSPDRTLRIDVTDDGPGIPNGQMKVLLQRGAKLDHSVEGHGIGLAIVREMVEDVYRGRLSFKTSDAGTLARVEIDFVQS
jgi:two-component system, OmpR family, sensor histidine kinase PhoQ